MDLDDLYRDPSAVWKKASKLNDGYSISTAPSSPGWSGARDVSESMFRLTLRSVKNHVRLGEVRLRTPSTRKRRAFPISS